MSHDYQYIRFSYTINLTEDKFLMTVKIFNAGSQILNTIELEYELEKIDVKYNNTMEYLEIFIYPVNKRIIIERIDEFVVMKLIGHNIVVPANIENLIMLQQLTNEINEITTDLYSPRLIKTADLDLKFKYDSNHLHHQIKFFLGEQAFTKTFQLSKPLRYIHFSNENNRISLSSSEISSYHQDTLLVERLPSLIRITNTLKGVKNYVYLPATDENLHEFRHISKIFKSELTAA